MENQNENNAAGIDESSDKQKVLEIFQTAPDFPVISLVNKWREYGPVDFSKNPNFTVPKDRDLKTSKMANLFFEGQVN